MDKLVAMRSFVEIVDRGSLTAAGEALDKSLPSMVRTLAALESELGARLLHRTTRRMSLTEEGRGYLERCRRILAEIEEAERELASDPVEPRGELRVTAPVLFGQLHVAPVVRAFLRRFDAVQVELVLLDRVVHLVEEGIDAAIRIGPLEDSSMIATTLGHVRRVVCASPEILERDGTPDSPRELADRECVLFRGLASGAHWQFRPPGERGLAVRVGGGFRCNQAAPAIEACAEGLGFGLFLSYQVDSLVRAGKLQVVLQEWEPAPLPVSVVYPEAHWLPSRLRAFVDLLKEEVGGRPQFQTD
jgi:DNA-binding transcriptional LysR family regulator